VVTAVAVALGCPIVRTAAAGPHWRELFVAAPLGDRLLEGYVDLLVRTEAGLAVVDYKTDARPPADGGVDPHHRTQLAAYAHALEHALGEPVTQAYLLYCRDAERPQRAVPDLAAAVAEVRAGLTVAPGP
jgi:ATP-dependent helicase/nuclease subunit A